MGRRRATVAPLDFFDRFIEYLSFSKTHLSTLVHELDGCRFIAIANTRDIGDG
jgi:hypothetical protein